MRGKNTLAGDLNGVANANSLAAVEMLFGAFTESGVVEVLKVRHYER